MTNLFLILSSVISCALIFALFILVVLLSSKRTIKGKNYLLVLIASLFVWTFFFILRNSAGDEDLKLIFMKAEYFGIILLPFFYAFLFKALIAKKQVKWYELLICAVISTGALLIIWLNPANLYYESVSFQEINGVFSAAVEYGILFYIFSAAYLFVLLAVSALIIYYSVKQKFILFQTVSILISLILPLVTAVLYVIKITNQDYTCSVLSIVAVILFISVNNYGIFESHVYVKRHLFDIIEEPLLIVNKDNKVSLINSAAEKLILKKQHETFGKSVFELFPGFEIKDKEVSVFQKNIHFPMREPLELRFKTVEIFSEARKTSERLLMVNNVTQICEIEKQLEYLLDHDAVTGLYNNKKLLNIMDEYAKTHGSLSGATLCALTVYNIDTLTGILSKDQKNRVYNAAAKFIAESSKCPNITARLAENEFCVFSNGATSDLGNYVTYLNNNSRINVNIDGESFQIEFKIGVYVIEENVSAKKALANVSYALRSSTFSTAQSVKIYDKSLKLQHNLHLGVCDKSIVPNFKRDFQLVFQPIIDRKNDRIVGAETFSRWHHPSLGVIQPNVFVPVLEDAKLIPEFGQMIIEKVVRSIKLIQEKMGKDFFISMNMSKRQLYDLSFPEKLKGKIIGEEINPASFIVEIKEPHIYADTAAAFKFAEKAIENGIGTAIDNFGWNNSCLSHIVDMKCSMAKLNTTFSTAVQNSPNKTAVVRYMVDLAEKIGVKLVSVHVETQKDLKNFEEMGIRLFQGMIFSQPLELEQFFKFCDARAMNN